MVVGSTGRWQSIADQLKFMSSLFNFTLNGKFHFQEPHFPETEENEIEKIVKNSYLNTRGIICY